MKIIQTISDTMKQTILDFLISPYISKLRENEDNLRERGRVYAEEGAYNSLLMRYMLRYAAVLPVIFPYIFPICYNPDKWRQNARTIVRKSYSANIRKDLINSGMSVKEADAVSTGMADLHDLEKRAACLSKDRRLREQERLDASKASKSFWAAYSNYKSGNFDIASLYRALGAYQTLGTDQRAYIEISGKKKLESCANAREMSLN